MNAKITIEAHGTKAEITFPDDSETINWVSIFIELLILVGHSRSVIEEEIREYLAID